MKCNRYNLARFQESSWFDIMLIFISKIEYDETWYKKCKQCNKESSNTYANVNACIGNTVRRILLRTGGMYIGIDE